MGTAGHIFKLHAWIITVTGDISAAAKAMGLKRPGAPLSICLTVPSHRSGRFTARVTPPTFTPALHTPASQHHNDFAERPCRNKEIKSRRFFFVPGTCQKHSCSSTTFTEHHQGRRTSHAESQLHQRLLHPRDEVELVQYIRRLTERHILPKTQMIINFATPLCRWEPSDSWVTRFLTRNSNTLITAWTNPMDTNRHNTDSSERYRLYLNLLHGKVTEFDVLPENTYNMDEKGFMIGVLGKTKRVFDKALHKAKRFKQASHNGNRVTVIGAICADGKTLPPAVIFSATGEKLQAIWTRDVDPKMHSLYLGYHQQAGRTMILVLPDLSRCLIPLPSGKLGESTGS